MWPKSRAETTLQPGPGSPLDVCPSALPSPFPVPDPEAAGWQGTGGAAGEHGPLPSGAARCRIGWGQRGPERKPSSYGTRGLLPADACLPASPCKQLKQQADRPARMAAKQRNSIFFCGLA